MDFARLSIDGLRILEIRAFPDLAGKVTEKGTKPYWVSVLDDKPALQEGQRYGAPTSEIVNGRVLRTFPVEAIPQPSYRDLRKAAYIKELSDEGRFEESVGDCMDDLVKQVEAMRQGLNAPALEGYAEKLAAIADIKRRFPKPDDAKD